MEANLQSPIFNDETAAREALEAVRWPNGPVCPHCGNADPETMPVVEGKKRTHRPGLRYCNACKGQFSVTVGTVFESSKIPLSKWWLAMHLMGASKKGISAHQLYRMLGLGSYRTAWFMAHRIREAMKVLNPPPMGGEGKTIEADETYIGNVKRNRDRRNHFVSGKGWVSDKGSGGPSEKFRVVALVERGASIRSVHVDTISAAKVREILVRNADRKSKLMTDEANVYTKVGREFASHGTVQHKSDEYVRGDVHTNTIEGAFSIFKRGMKGIYQHCSEAHLQRYLDEFDFRYNRRTVLGWNDAARVKAIAEGIEGKRLTYRRPN
jgi:transposase-like protein